MVKHADAVEDGEWRPLRLGPKQGSVTKREEVSEDDDPGSCVSISASFKAQADS